MKIGFLSHADEVAERLTCLGTSQVGYLIQVSLAWMLPDGPQAPGDLWVLAGHETHEKEAAVIAGDCLGFNISTFTGMVGGQRDLAVKARELATRLKASKSQAVLICDTLHTGEGCDMATPFLDHWGITPPEQWPGSFDPPRLVMIDTIAKTVAFAFAPFPPAKER